MSWHQSFLINGNKDVPYKAAFTFRSWLHLKFLSAHHYKDENLSNMMNFVFKNNPCYQQLAILTIFFLY